MPFWAHVVGFLWLAFAHVSFGAVAQTPAEDQIGTGEAGAAQENCRKDSAKLNSPFDAVFDPAGNLVFSDTGNHRIRKVDAKTGRITILAGTGQPGFSGDGGPAPQARLNEPYGVASDGEANIYFADRLHRRVRRIDAKTGLITTVAGTGVRGSDGDGGAAAAASLVEPNGVAIDANRKALYIADVAAHRIRAVNLVDGTITTLAGDGRPMHAGDGHRAPEASIHGARAVEVGSNGLVYIVEREGNTVRSIDPRTGLVTTLAGKGSLGYSGDGGPGAEATFRGPKEIAAAPNGDLYVVDTENHAVRRIDAKTGTVSTVAGTGRPGRGPESLDRPHGVAVGPRGDVWVVDTGNHRIVRVKQ
jgi:sugar lactone lactonase YvrE